MVKFRSDIQALRGVAVSLVVLEHVGVSALPYGYLGVDIFFVISGFLISGIISRQLQAENFSFAEFYIRRAKRLLPAAYVTILLTAIGGAWFLNSIEAQSLTAQIAGALTFSINFVLLGQIGYFEVGSAFKPLLHMWSLAIEEQFYVFFPAILAFTPRSYWKFVIVFVAVLSFAICVFLSLTQPNAAFYLLPSRAWELLVGAFGALISGAPSVVRVARMLFFPAIVALCVTPFWSTGLPHPGADSVIVCLSTLLVILAQKERAFSASHFWVVRKVGDISYSLYLVHWPIIVFMNSAYVENVPNSARVVAVGVSLAIAIALYRFVELPFKDKEMSRPAVVAAFVSLALAVFVAHIVVKSSSRPILDFAEIRSPNYGLDKACGFQRYKDLEKCKTSSSPKVIVWGDSYAMHVVPGLVQAHSMDLRQATSSACAPFVDVAPYFEKADYRERRAKECISFNDDVIKFIAGQPEIEVVVLAASYWQYTSASHKVFARNSSGQFGVQSSGLERAKADMRRVIDGVKLLGKRVVVVAPPPPITNQHLSCMERTLSKKFVFGVSSSCELDVKRYEEVHAGVISLMEYTEHELGVPVIRISDALCSAGACKTVLDDFPVYRDNGHLSYGGSVEVFERLPLVGVFK